MQVNKFLVFLSLSFAVPAAALVMFPALNMSKAKLPEYSQKLDEQTGLYENRRFGLITEGSKAFARQGCAVCHTQVIRSSNEQYADLWRADWAGAKTDEGDTRRVSTWMDYANESRGVATFLRIGPDLSNVGKRVERALMVKDQDGNTSMSGSAETWFYSHLYNPRDAKLKRPWSTCPSHAHLFEEQTAYGAAQTLSSLPLGGSQGQLVVPNSEAQKIVSYLMSMRRDSKLPAAATPPAAPTPAAQ